MNVPDVLWSLVVIGLLVGFFVLLFRVVLDVFRSTDLPVLAKVGWFVAALVVPVVGVLAYLIVRGRGIAAREQLASARARLASGAITPEEYEALRTRAVSD